MHKKNFQVRLPNILVTGSHRSGTTWVGRTLSQHKTIRYISEPFNPNYPNAEVGLKLSNWFTHAPTSSKKTEIEESFNNFLKPSLLQLSKRLYNSPKRDLIKNFHFSKNLFFTALGHERILIKDPIALLSAGWLYERYNIKVICLIRNPLSFVGSLKAANWNYYFHDLKAQERLLNTWLSPFKSEIERYAEKPSDIIDHGCLLWNIFHYVITDYQKLYPTWTFIKYEDVVANPIIEFGKLFDALGLRIDSSIRRYIHNYTSKKNPSAKNSPTYGPRNAKDCLTAWKDRLTPEEIKRVKDATITIGKKFYGKLY